MELLISPLSFLDPQRDIEREPHGSQQTDSAAEHEPRLLCARCRHAITRRSRQIAVNGAHTHTFTNPHGLTFHIGCYRDAPGCTEAGTATTEFTWFPGYAWRFAECGGCGVHLGWLFTSTADGFYGLIVDRLTSGGPAPT